MGARDALDVIHVIFEEDLMAATKEEIDNKHIVRKRLYRELYDTTYKYGVDSADESYNYSTASDGFIGEPEDDKVEKPTKQAKKPYIPPTDINPNSTKPFGKMIEPPLGQ